MDLIRDSAWQFIGVLVSIVAIVITIVIPGFQQARKDLRYDIVYNGPLFVLVGAAAGRLKVMFDNKPLNDATMILTTISNEGKSPINLQDYEQPVTIFFDDNVRVFHAEIITTNPENINSSVSYNQSQVDLAPTLLNKGDNITLKIILDKPAKNMYIDSRISGIAEPKSQQSGPVKTFFSLNSTKIAIYGLLGTIFLSGLLLFQLPQTDPAGNIDTVLVIYEGLGRLGVSLMMNALFVLILLLATYGGYSRLKPRINVSTKKKPKMQVIAANKQQTKSTTKVTRGKQINEKS